MSATKHTRIAMLRNGWTEGHDDAAACPHRDLSVCPSCASEYADILLESYETHWIMPTIEAAFLAKAEMLREGL